LTAKEFLSQAWRIDRMVNAKMRQVQTLRSHAEMATSSLSGSPLKGSRNNHRMEDILAKILDMESEINADIDRLVKLKQDIITAIRVVENEDYTIFP